jgi:aromatic ring-cleaving dioxygenase
MCAAADAANELTYHEATDRSDRYFLFRSHSATGGHVMTKRPENLHSHYHAHVYFDASTIGEARELCEGAAQKFGVALGRMHERPVGPHPHWSCQLAFDSRVFDELVPWLDEHRGALTVLVHADTGNHLEDHTVHAAWLGEPAELDLSIFKE